MPKKETAIMLNGEKVTPIKKRKLPAGFDWQKAAVEKQAELEAAKRSSD